MTIAPIQAIGGLAALDPTLAAPITTSHPAHSSTSFASLMTDGIEQVNQKLMDADAASTAFALDDSIPLHQVTYALEQARLSFELMLQVRSRLVESFQELSRMQL